MALMFAGPAYGRQLAERLGSAVPDDEDMVITPAMRAYLAAFEAWLRDDCAEARERRQEALTGLREDAGLGRVALRLRELAARPPRALTRRETQILRLRTAGLTCPAIAVLLGISVKTVGRHNEAIIAKAGTGNPFRLMAWALRRGLARVD